MRGIYKKLTFEDKFARKYYCNSYRFLPDMKKQNRRKLRRLLRVRIGEDMDNDEKCRYREACGYDFCHGEGVCPDFEEGELYTGEEEREVRIWQQTAK